MVTLRRTEIALTAFLALMLFQLAFRPVTLNAITLPLRLIKVSFAAVPSSPAYSATLVFTSAVSFEMVPAHDGIKAQGRGAYTVSDDVAHISLRLTDLAPNGVYGIQCVHAASASGAFAGNTPCSLKKPTVTADWKGKASFSIDRALLEASTAENATAIVVVLNDKDGGMPETQLSYVFPVTESL